MSVPLVLTLAGAPTLTDPKNPDWDDFYSRHWPFGPTEGSEQTWQMNEALTSHLSKGCFARPIGSPVQDVMIGPEFAQISQAQFGRLQFPKQERLKSDRAQEFPNLPA